MRIRSARRISQLFFLVLFLWFCTVTSLGDKWWQLRGWPVNWILELDPLVGLSTILSTRTLYKGLLWGLATVLLTIVLGRFFCGWLCPFGTIHQFLGYLARRRRTIPEKARLNRYHPFQRFKYWVLVFLLAVAAADLLLYAAGVPGRYPGWFWALAAGLLVIAAVLALLRVRPNAGGRLLAFSLIALAWGLIGSALPVQPGSAASLQIGLLDPLPLVYRSVNLIVMPLVDRTNIGISPMPRYYPGAWLIGTIFLAALLLNFKVPRFYCRFICPLGALFGIVGRHALWRIGKKEAEWLDCRICEANCEGACEPATTIRTAECVLCMNCLMDCRHHLIGFRTSPSEAGEIAGPDITRRQILLAAVCGVSAVPMVRLGGQLAANWNPVMIRPPGSLAEQEFLTRCIKCGQCMRICPTNVIHPAGLQAGLEGLWTPVLNFRVGTSGCQYKCIACGNICPTAAIRPITLDERLGRNRFAAAGPLRIGTAFVDRGRCLPWAMNIPCIVCQENCPVSPKAIVTQAAYAAVSPGGTPVVATASAHRITFAEPVLEAGRFATGDYYCRPSSGIEEAPRRILGNSARELELVQDPSWLTVPQPGSVIEILIRLQQPQVVPKNCIGCGVCEHECPVTGKRAIRVTAENESRDRSHTMLLDL